MALGGGEKWVGGVAWGFLLTGDPSHQHPYQHTHPNTPQDIEFPAQDAWAAIRGGCIAAFSSDVEGMEEEQLEVGACVPNIIWGGGGYSTATKALLQPTYYHHPPTTHTYHNENTRWQVVFELAPGRYGKEDLEANFKSVTAAIKKVRQPAFPCLPVRPLSSFLFSFAFFIQPHLPPVCLRPPTPPKPHHPNQRTGLDVYPLPIPPPPIHPSARA